MFDDLAAFSQLIGLSLRKRAPLLLAPRMNQRADMGRPHYHATVIGISVQRRIGVLRSNVAHGNVRTSSRLSHFNKLANVVGNRPHRPCVRSGWPKAAPKRQKIKNRHVPQLDSMQ